MNSRMQQELQDYQTELHQLIIQDSQPSQPPSNNLMAEEETETTLTPPPVPESTVNVLGLMISNLVEIKGYFLISKEQATKAFRLAVAASIWGMLLLTAAVIVGFTSQNTAAAIIAAASGAVVEIFAGSVLVVYNRTLSQLNYYYSKLHNNERLLVLINLVDKLSGDTKKDALFTAIIKSELKSLALAEDTAALSQAAAPDPSAPALAVAAASDNTATPADAPAASPANAGGQQSASGGSGSPADHGSQKPAAK